VVILVGDWWVLGGGGIWARFEIENRETCVTSDNLKIVVRWDLAGTRKKGKNGDCGRENNWLICDY
jgi:hypothetical protein